MGSNTIGRMPSDVIHSVPVSVWFSGIAIARNRHPFSTGSAIRYRPLVSVLSVDRFTVTSKPAGWPAFAGGPPG